MEDEKIGAVNDHKIYVAVGKDVKESKLNLVWALANAKGSKICILHVHVPPKKMPFRDGSSSYDPRKEHQIREFNRIERTKIHKVLEEYSLICTQAGVVAEKLFVERDFIENGIVELINRHVIKKLVMGAAGNRLFARKITGIKSQKAKYVRVYAPHFCYIWFVYKGQLIYTRSYSGGLNTEAVSLLNRVSPNSEIGESSSSKPIVSMENNKDKISDRSNNDKNPHTDVNPNKLFKEEDSFSFSFESMDEERDYLSLPSIKEFKQKIKFDEALKSVNEEVEKLKWQLNEAMENIQATKEQNFILTNRIANYNKTIQELEQKVCSASGLLQNFKKYRDEMGIERDNALILTNELRDHALQKGSTSNTSDCHFFAEISFAEIQEATRNFDKSLKIMERDSIISYRGFIRNTQVTIKMIQPYNWQSISKFHQEVNILSKLRHPNLIALIGVCPRIRALVLEYYPNGHLYDRLICKNETPPLSWQTRIRIASDLCSVLIFLHSWKPDPIIYANLNTSNILLDSNLVAKLSDLGICPPKVNRFAMDSYAYIAPECLESLELTPESNVYSFGIILLRLLTGRPALGLTFEVKNALHEGKFNELLDSTAGDWPFVKANQLAHLAMKCCEIKPLGRPDLSSEVWKVFESMTSPRQISSFQLDSEGNRQIPESFLCPIYQEIMEDPVIATDGFSYEAEAIKQWFVGGHKTSPMTNLKLKNCNLLPNRALRSAIQAWLQQA